MKWGFAASAILLLLGLSVWTLLYGKPAGRTAPKVEEEFHKPSISLGGASNDENVDSIELAKTDDATTSSAPSPINLGVYPRPMSSARLNELAAQIAPAETGISDLVLNTTATHPTPEQREWLDQHNPLVCGLTFQNTSIACPLPILTGAGQSRLLQLETNGQAWLLAWCAESQTLVAYERTVEGITLNFRSSSLRCLGNSIFVDSDSESQWCTILGTALKGQLAGSKLKRIPLTVATWNSWRKTYVDSHVIWATSENPTLASDTLVELAFQPEDDWGLGFATATQSSYLSWQEVAAVGTKTVNVGPIRLAAFYDQNRNQITTVLLTQDLEEIEFSRPTATGNSLNDSPMTTATAETKDESTKQESPVKLPSGERLCYPRGEWWEDLIAETPVETKLPQLFPIYTRKAVWSKFHPPGE